MQMFQFSIFTAVTHFWYPTLGKHPTEGGSTKTASWIKSLYTQNIV